MTVAHHEQPSLRKHCDGIGRYLPAVTKGTAAQQRRAGTPPGTCC